MFAQSLTVRHPLVCPTKMRATQRLELALQLAMLCEQAEAFSVKIGELCEGQRRVDLGGTRMYGGRERKTTMDFSHVSRAHTFGGPPFEPLTTFRDQRSGVHPNVPAGGQAAAAPPLTLVLNWPATLKQ